MSMSSKNSDLEKKPAVDEVASLSVDEDLIDDDAQKDRYLTFKLANEDYGLDISHVKEIVGLQKITTLPDMPNFVKGVINLRGTVIPVIDMRTRFRLGPEAYNDRTCVIVVNIGQVKVGLVVDTVREVLTIPDTHISPPPKVRSGDSNCFVRGLGRVDDQIKILLDINQLLCNKELTELQPKDSQ